MAYGDKTRAQVHRFRDRVAIHVHSENGKVETVYLDPKTARKLGGALSACALDCEDYPKFSESTFRTVEINGD